MTSCAAPLLLGDPPRNLRPGDRLGAGRFEVHRVLSFSDAGGLYEVLDRSTHAPWVALEVIPPADMPLQERERRALRLARVVASMAGLEHPCLARVRGLESEGSRLYVLLEKVGGVDLAAEVRARPEGLPRRQALRWVRDACSALRSLQERGVLLPPFLQPEHLRVLAHRSLKLVNYGLRRVYFEPLEGSGPGLAPSMGSLGRLLAFLITGKTQGETGPLEFGVLTPELAWVSSRCLSGDSRVYGSFLILETALEHFLAPGSGLDLLGGTRDAPAEEPKAARRSAWSRWRRPAVAALALAVLAGSLVAAGLARSPAPRSGPMGYVVAGDSLLRIDPGSYRLAGRISLGGPSAGMAATPDGLRLYVAQPERSRVLVVDTRAGRPVAVIPTEAGPRDLVMDAEGRRLYVLHGASGIVEVVEIDPEPPVLAASDPLPSSRDRVTGILAGGSPPLSLAPGASGQGVYLSSLTDRRVLSLGLHPPVVLATAPVAAGGPLALGPDGRTLYVADSGGKGLLELDTRTLAPRGDWISPGGRHPVDLLVSPDGSRLWCVDRTGTLGEVDPAARRLVKTVGVDGRPLSARFVDGPGGPVIWVATADPDQVTVLDPRHGTLVATVPTDGAPGAMAVVLPAPTEARPAAGGQGG